MNVIAYMNTFHRYLSGLANRTVEDGVARTCFLASSAFLFTSSKVEGVTIDPEVPLFG
jgi:predicted RNA methylase